jgi:hypothetical protein
MVKKGGELGEVAKLVDRLLADTESEPFRSPVLWKEWGLLDYPEVVKEPMDLGTVKKNLAAGKYSDLGAVVRHIKLVWSNCMAYNSSSSDLHKAAKKMDKAFDRDVAKVAVKREAPSGGSAAGKADKEKKAGKGDKSGRAREPSIKGASMEDKAAFCKMLYEVNEINLGKLVVALDEKCEKALLKSADDEVEINVDAIDLATFRRVEALLRELLAGEKAASGKSVGNKKPVAAGAASTPGKKGDSAKRAADEDAAGGRPTKKAKADGEEEEEEEEEEDDDEDDEDDDEDDEDDEAENDE